MKTRVVVTRRLPFPALDRLSAAGHELVVWPDRAPPDEQQLHQLLTGAHAAITMLTDRVDAAALDAAGPQLRVVANYAVGTDNVDLDAARERGVLVGATPGVLTDATADLTMALLLALARRLPEGERAVHAGEWVTWEPAWLLGTDLHGLTLGLLGHGRIAQAVARRAEAFGMEVVHTARTSGIPWAELLERADVLSLHAPLTPGTRGLVDADALARLRPGALLVNTARGAIVDQQALAAALHAGRLAGAALDVTDPEPLPSEHPLLRAPNLLVLPHLGSATRQTRARMAELAVANVEAGLRGAPLPHPAGG